MGLGELGRGGRPLRIAYGRVFHEGNAFSPLRTTKDDFIRFHAYEGDELAQKCTLLGYELDGFIRIAELSGFVQAARLAGNVETVPLASFMTVPSGKLDADAFGYIRERMQERLRAAGDVDGVYLALHGSMQVDGLGEAPEGVLIADAKEITGKPIGASFDLHGNLSSTIAEPLTVLTAYRTNPHRDLFQTGFRAGTRLIRALRDQIRPTHAWRKLPMLLGGGLTIDFLKPMRGIFRHLKHLERQPGVLSAHVFMVHPYNDAPDLGWAVHVTTDDDQARADEIADDLADRIFALRYDEPPSFLSTADALAEVKKKKLARKTGTVSLVDTADVVGAGSPGGNTHVLAELLEDPSLRVYVPIHDPVAVAACEGASIGDTIDVTIRGIDTGSGEPAVPVHATVAARATNESGNVVRLDVGRLSVAITDRPPLTIAPGFWRDVGLSPWDADAIVQKNFFHYRVFYAAVNRGNVPVASAGATSFDHLKTLELDLPVWPQADVTDWRPFDRARRGLGEDAAQPDAA